MYNNTPASAAAAHFHYQSNQSIRDFSRNRDNSAVASTNAGTLRRPYYV